jgi:periplasmic protein TonB
MKRNEKKVPEFDEIIFENRNKLYGAYDIRKRYNSVTTISVITGAILCSALVLSVYFSTDEAKATTGQTEVVITISDPVLPEYTPPEDPKPPQDMIKIDAYVAPVVTTDSTITTNFLPITDDQIANAQDGVATDSIRVIENPDPVIPPEEKIFIIVQEYPEFPGGQSALMQFIGENVRYPSEAERNNIQGRVVLKFVVNTNGSVDRIQVLASVDPSLDAEAIRVVNSLPKFRPGKQGGVPVPVWFVLPVLFRIENQ